MASRMASTIKWAHHLVQKTVNQMGYCLDSLKSMAFHSAESSGMVLH